MCWDPWENSVAEFGGLYLDAIAESTNPNRSPGHRHQWSGRVERFAAGYAEKLEELELDDLEELRDEMIADEAEPVLVEAVERELKSRAEAGAMV